MTITSLCIHNSIAARIFTQLAWDTNMETECEYEDEDEIFSILSSAKAWTNVILAPKHDSRLHSTESFSQNVVLADTGYKVL